MDSDPSDLRGFWEFLWFRPGLDATYAEWSRVLGDNVWSLLRRDLFTVNGIAESCLDITGHRYNVVLLSDGYALVDDSTGSCVSRGLEKKEVQLYQLNLEGFRRLIAEALGLQPDETPLNNPHGIFPIGTWSPVCGVQISVYAHLPATHNQQEKELQRFFLSAPTEGIVLTPQESKLSLDNRQISENSKLMLASFKELVSWEEGQFSALAAWGEAQNAFCGKYLTDSSMVVLPEHQFAKKGMWAIRFHGKDTYLDGNLKGASFIYQLLLHQGKPIHVIQLMSQVAGVQGVDLNPLAEGLNTDRPDAQKAIDDKTKRNCEDAFNALVAERDSGNATDDRIEEIEKEISDIASYLASSCGLGGKSRKLGDEVDAARRRIARVIGTVYEKIEENDSALATHLKNSIKTRTEMVYTPDQEVNWVLQ